MILHYYYFENWKTRQGYNYLQISNEKFDFSISILVSAIDV